MSCFYNKAENNPSYKCTLHLQSNPQKDVDVLKSEISFKNPELIQVKASWKEDGAMDLLKGLKEKVPKMADALYNAVNKYHHEHTGMDINTATLKLKDNLRDNVDTAYRNTMNNINELEQQLHEVTNEATGKYEIMRKKAKKLYHEAADQADQMDYDQIRAEFYDATMNIIADYHERVKHLIDSAIEFVKVTRFQVPGIAGKHTGEQLYVMATKKLADVADLCITRVQEYFDALIVFVSELEVKIPTSSEIIKGSAILDEIKIFITHVQRKVSQIFVGLQEIDFAQHLRELKVVVQEVFQKVEELIRNLQAQNYEYVKDQTKQLFTKLLQALKSLAENIKHLAPRVENLLQNFVWSSSRKLEELLQTVKDLREEYFDPSIVGWSVKYYEVEEKVLAWLKSFVKAVIEWYTKYAEDASDLVVRLVEKANEFVENHGKVTEYSKMTHEKILYWSEAAKKSAAEQNKEVNAKVQEAYEYLLDSYARLITETKKLIDLTIENYTAFLQYLQSFLNGLEKATADTLRPYVVVRQGELRIDIPKPFDLPSINSVYQMPQSSEEDLQKKPTDSARH